MVLSVLATPERSSTARTAAPLQSRPSTARSSPQSPRQLLPSIVNDPARLVKDLLRTDAAHLVKDSVRITSLMSSNGLLGEGAVKWTVMHAELRALEDTVQCVETKLAEAIEALTQSQAACVAASEEREHYRRALALDAALAPDSGPLQLSGELATWGGAGINSPDSLWGHLSFHAIKKERERRTDLAEQHAAALDDLRVHANAEQARLQAELEVLHRALVREYAKHHLTADAEPLDTVTARALEAAGKAANQAMAAVAEAKERVEDEEDGGSVDSESRLSIECRLLSHWRCADLFERVRPHELLGDAFEIQIRSAAGLLHPGEVSAPRASREDGQRMRDLLARVVAVAIAGDGGIDGCDADDDGGDDDGRSGGRHSRLPTRGATAHARLRAMVSDILRSAPLLDALADGLCTSLIDFAREHRELESGLERRQPDAPRPFVDHLWTERLRSGEPPEPPAPTGISFVEWDEPATWPDGALEGGFACGAPELAGASISTILGALPSTDGVPAMAREHLLGADATVTFVEPTRRIRTSSHLEWYLVVDPHLALKALDLRQWEVRGRDHARPTQEGESFLSPDYTPGLHPDYTPDYTPAHLGSRLVANATSAHFRAKLARVNQQLAAAGDALPLGLEAFCALRLYTGPCGLKYQMSLRAASTSARALAATSEDVHADPSTGVHAFVLGYQRHVNCGNTYPTTIAHISLGITKLARLAAATPVYRALSGPLSMAIVGALASGGNGATRWGTGGGGAQVRGGVEVGFISANTSLAAIKKAAARAGCSVLLELHPGPTPASRGAHLEWLDQFGNHGSDGEGGRGSGGDVSVGGTVGGGGGGYDGTSGASAPVSAPVSASVSPGVVFGPLLDVHVLRIRADGAFVVLEATATSAAAERSATELEGMREVELLFQHLCSDAGQADFKKFAGSLDLGGTSLELLEHGGGTRGSGGGGGEGGSDAGPPRPPHPPGSGGGGESRPPWRPPVLRLMPHTRASHVHRRVRAEAAAYVMHEAARCAGVLEALGHRGGGEHGAVELQAIMHMAKLTANRAEQKEDATRTASWGLAARERGIAEIEVASRLDVGDGGTV
jgi:hypothetical protein